MIGIEAVAAHHPERQLLASESWYLDLVRLQPGKTLRAPKAVRRMEGTDSVERMSLAVSKAVLTRAGIGIGAIDWIIVCEVGGPILPGGSFLHHQLEAPLEMPVTTLQDGPAGFINGLYLAANLVRIERARRVLVVGSTCWDVFGEGIVDPTDPLYRTLGDAACAAIVSSTHVKAEYLAYSAQSCSSLYKHMGVKSGPRQNPELGVWVRSSSNQIRIGNYLRMDDEADTWLREGVADYAANGLKAAAEKAGVNAIDRVLFSQMGSLSDGWADKAAPVAPKSVWRDTFDFYGDMGSATIGANLAHFSDAGEFAVGQTIGLFATGAGGQTPTMLLRWC